VAKIAKLCVLLQLIAASIAKAVRSRLVFARESRRFHHVHKN
jgi:hypothetical protein